MELKLTGTLLSYIEVIAGSLVIFLFSALFTGTTRLYAIKKSILDIPNERSSHAIPTPRGGGIAIVLTFTFVLFGLKWANYIQTNLYLALIGGGITIATTGYCDDIYSVSAKWRILLHSLAAAWALYWMGSFSFLTLASPHILLDIVNYTLTAIGIVWYINFYNFMDGIDGLAGSEGMFVAMGSSIALWWTGAPYLALVMSLLAASIAGFTIWNWPPAKIFLGDVGSGYLGYIFAVLGLYTANNNILPITFWWVMLAIFICDATFTLLYRMYQGKKWYSAHREHAYQHLISFGANHKRVTTSILIINCCVLLPIAFTLLQWPAASKLCLNILIICLFLTWIKIKSLAVPSRNF